MKRYYILTTVAILLLLCMQAFYAMSLYSDYANRFCYNFDEIYYTSIDKEYFESSLKHSGLDHRKHDQKTYQTYAVEDMPPGMFDSLQKAHPMPPPPPSYNIDQLIADGILRNASDIAYQVTRNAYYDKGVRFNVAIFDSIFTADFGHSVDHCFVVTDSLGNITSSTSKKELSSYSKKTTPYKLGIQARETVVGYYNIPLFSFIIHSTWSLAASLLMLAVVVMSLMVQIKIIRKKQVALTRINQNINGTIHDLKSPLAGLSMTIGVAKKMATSDELRRIFTLNQSNIKNLIATIDSLLSVARRNNAMHKQEITVEQLTSTVDAIISDLDTLYAHKPHTIAVENRLPSDITFTADALHIESIVRNLLDNAIKYADAVVNIQLLLANNDKTITFVITDNGWGIPSKYHKKLRKEFFQVPRTVESPRGYGVGLTHVYNIIRAHNGTIDIESTVGKGTIFTVKIPRNG